VVGLG